MTVKLKNNATGFLASAISATDITAALTAGTGATFPSLGAGEYFYATITATNGVYEIVKVTARTTDALSITRAQEETSALAFAAGSKVELRVTAQNVVDAITDQLDIFKADYFAATGSGVSVGLHIGAGKTLNATDGILLLPAVLVPSQTVDGSLVWDSDNDLLTVGTGITRKTMVDTDTAQTLINKTLTFPTISVISNSGTLTLPTSTDTLVGRATADTLTNKTLVAPVISTISNTGTLTLPTSTDTLVGRATADTLTNKTLSSPVFSGTATGNLTTTGGVQSTSPTAGIGYATGAGGAETQQTSKATGVTLNTICGQITMNAAALNAGTAVSFTLTNSTIAANDALVLNHVSGGTAGAYTLNAQAAAGSASINVRNVTAGNLSEAIVIRFTVIKSAIS